MVSTGVLRICRTLLPSTMACLVTGRGRLHLRFRPLFLRHQTVQPACQIRFGVGDETLQIRFAGVRIVLLCHQAVVQFDGICLNMECRKSFMGITFLTVISAPLALGILNLNSCNTWTSQCGHKTYASEIYTNFVFLIH